MTRVLLTGGAGFIGSHYVLRHVRQHPTDKVVVIDALTYAADKSLLDPVMDRISFVEGDIANLPLLEAIVEQHHIDTIVNFAAETHVDRSIQNAVPFLHSNVLGVQSLIELCKKHPKILLVHISTDEVYGDLTDVDPSFTLASPLRPSSPYAATKASGDLLLLAAARTFGARKTGGYCDSLCRHRADRRADDEDAAREARHSALLFGRSDRGFAAFNAAR